MSESTNQKIVAAWLRLIRWPNLLIIAGTQFVAWWCVVRQLQSARVLTFGHFALLCFSTVLIAAGGYIINDYFDIRIDAINKPEKVILERTIPRRLAIIVHSVVNVAAFLLAALIAVPAGHPEWLVMQIICTLVLWRYSTSWKRQFVIGNIVVAAMTALTVVTLILYEPSLGTHLPDVPGWKTTLGWQLYKRLDPSMVLWVFALFAFLLTWMREIVKDMEDYKGDDAEGCVTMPIKWGLLRSTRFIQVLGGLVCVMLIISALALVANSCFLPVALIIVLIIRLGKWLLMLPEHADKKHYATMSRSLKQIMVIGLCVLILLALSTIIGPFTMSPSFG